MEKKLEEVKKKSKIDTKSNNAKKTTKKSVSKKSTVKNTEQKKVDSKKVSNKTVKDIKKDVVKESDDDKVIKKAIKQEKIKINYNTEESNEIKRFLIVILIVLCLAGCIYLITRAFITKDLFDNKSTEEEPFVGEINNNAAIFGTMLNRSESSYYVAIYDCVEGEYIYDMSSMISSYNTKEGHLHLYTIDLSDYLNKNYYDPENVNVNAKTLDEIKVGDITLIKVTTDKKGNKQISKYLVNLEDMKKELGV